jgi:hypothetical protein
LNFTQSTLAGDTALQLGAHFVGGAFFQGIRAARDEKKQRKQ